MALDTERAARRLTDAGMEERAANGVADVMADATDGLATEAGLERLEARMDTRFAEFEGRVDTRFAELEARMDTRFAESEARMEAGFAEMRAEIAESRADAADFRADIYRALWIQGLGILAGTAAIVTIIMALD